MKRVFVAVVFILLAFAAYAEDGFDINSFDATLDLRVNGEMQVTERIAVTFTEQKHGIFRVIPVDYDTSRTTRRVTIRLQSVTDGDGRTLGTKVTREGPNLRIRIGDKDVYLEPGTQITYVIHYVAFGMINWFDEDKDWKSEAQLYWNVTGDQWTTTIQKSSFIVHFPKSPTPKQNRLAVYAGAYGSRDSNRLAGPGTNTDSQTQTSIALTDSEARGECSMPLYPGSGFTVVLGIPSQLIEKPSLAQRIQLAVLPNLGFLVPLVILPLMWAMWSVFGRDPYGGPMVVQYDAPDGLTGSEAGAMIDERVDDRDVAASIVSLAVKGYLTITPDEQGTIFKHKSVTLQTTEKKEDPSLSTTESLMLGAIEGAGGTVDEADMRAHIAPLVSSMRQSVYQSLVDRGYYNSSPETARIVWFLGGAAIAGLLAFLCYVVSPFDNPIPSVVGGIISALIVGLFANAMPQRTKKGAVVREQVRGFAEFIGRARGKELDWMTKKQPDMALFETYLPHAVAFGLTREWCAAFESLLQESPSWYRGPAGNYYFMNFGNDFSNMTDTMTRAATTPPRSSGGSGGSSGFGGGGFSGGGFGGGGGGSW